MSIPYSDLRRDRKEIRLLQLLPSPGPQYARIPCCRLLRTNLRAAPSYNALSYAWGDAETNRVIIVDDIHIRIPQNLFDALITLRPSQLTPFLLWVDYLCINQRNDTEKAWQVGLMRDIYSKADHVLAWLGPGDCESQRAMEYLDTLGEEAVLCGFYHNLHIGDMIWQGLAMLYSAHPRDTSFDLILMRLGEILDTTFGQNVHASALTAMLRLGKLFHKINGWSSKGNGFPVREMRKILERPWFGRSWVLQEIALSKRATFVCGTARIDRARLSAAINAYQCFRQCLPAVLCGRNGANNVVGPVTSYHCEAFRELFFRATTMANAHRIAMMDEFPLIALLRLTCVGSPNHQKHGPHHLDSSDPRDKIFALLGLATDRKDLSARGVIPDYTKSCWEVYTSTTAAMLQQGHLSLLSFIQPGRGSGLESLPSWVPNWYSPITEPLQIVLDDHMILTPEFGASGTDKSIPAIRVRRYPSGIIYGISLQGFVCDTVYSVGLFPGRESSWDVPLEETFSWPQEWLVEILRLTYRTKSYYASFEERLHAVARASVGGVRLDLQGDVVRTGEEVFFEAGHLLRQSLHRIKNRHIQTEACKFLARNGIENVSRDVKPLSLQLPHDIIGRSLKRLPFITAAGRLGLGYENIQVGDIVTIITGAQVPYILRSQQTGTYNLVSEAYVDRIMDGEALRGATFIRLEIM
ncbi:heterokaryon incompatibility protein-domain-containing protein [Xylaria flabelliformis]|nr:heterokaryon incompatibility protein-domain-containing protein [Xylaria flabelliformis]